MKNIRYLVDSLLIDGKILVFGDLHLGENFGILNEKDCLNKLKELFNELEKKKLKIEKIIILGDIKQEFSKVLESEWSEVLEIIDYLLTKVKKENIILIKGNHDNYLANILEKRKIKLRDFYEEDDCLFLHGDKEIKSKCNNIFLGHLHPAITIKDRYKKEKYKCFLVGKHKNKNYYILPSFSTKSYGFELKEINETNEEHLIISKKILEKFYVFIYEPKEDKTYDFGKLKDLIKK